MNPRARQRSNDVSCHVIFFYFFYFFDTDLLAGRATFSRAAVFSARMSSIEELEKRQRRICRNMNKHMATLRVLLNRSDIGISQRSATLSAYSLATEMSDKLTKWNDAILEALEPGDDEEDAEFCDDEASETSEGEEEPPDILDDGIVALTTGETEMTRNIDNEAGAKPGVSKVACTKHTTVSPQVCSKQETTSEALPVKRHWMEILKQNQSRR